MDWDRWMEMDTSKNYLQKKLRRWFRRATLRTQPIPTRNEFLCRIPSSKDHLTPKPNRDALQRTTFRFRIHHSNPACVCIKDTIHGCLAVRLLRIKSHFAQHHHCQRATGEFYYFIFEYIACSERITTHRPAMFMFVCGPKKFIWISCAKKGAENTRRRRWWRGATTSSTENSTAHVAIVCGCA